MTTVGGEGMGGRLVVAALIIFAAATPLLPIYTWKADATLLSACLLVVAFYIRWRTGSGLARSGLDLPAIVFLGLAGLATAFSVNPFLSLVPSNRTGEGLLVYIGYVAALLAAARLNRHQMDRVLGAVLVSGAIIGAAGTAQHFGVDVPGWLGFHSVTQASFYGLDAAARPVLYRFGRSNATLGNPIFLGGYVTLLLPMAVALTVQRRGWRSWAWGLGGVLLFGALVGSQTRAAWIATGLGVFFVTLLLVRNPQTRRRLAMLALACVILGGGMLARHAPLLQRAASTLDPSDPALGERFYLWKHTLPMIAQRPLLGWGFSSLLGRFPDIGSAEYVRLFGFTVSGIDTPHNDLLHIAYSIGLLGLGVYLWLWIVFGRSLRRALAAGGEIAALAAGLAGGLGGYLLWVQTAWLQVGTAHLFWTFGAMAVALAREAAGQSASLAVTYTGGDTPFASGA